jgi:hypothetical protein
MGRGEAAELAFDVFDVVGMHVHRRATRRKISDEITQRFSGVLGAIEFEEEFHGVRERTTAELGVRLREEFCADVHRQAGGFHVLSGDDVAFHVRRGKLRSVVAIHGEPVQDQLGFALRNRCFCESFSLPFATFVKRKLIDRSAPILDRVDFDFVLSVRENDGLAYDFGWFVNRVSCKP